MTAQLPDQPISVSDSVYCSQCGGELHPDEGQIFLTCPYCGATVFLDHSKVVFHWYVAPTLNEQNVQSALYRWMSGSQTVKDLDKKSRVVGESFSYFPVWFFKLQHHGKEEVSLYPAAATSISELSSLKIPAGDLKKYSAELDSQAIAPSIPLDAAIQWTRERRLGAAPGGSAVISPPQHEESGIQEAALVHIPLYFFKYLYGGVTYTAIVDAASGVVLANIFPAKKEAPYVLVGLITALVFLCLAIIPVVFALSDTPSIGMFICSGLGLLAAPLLFAWAFWVASKV